VTVAPQHRKESNADTGRRCTQNTLMLPCGSKTVGHALDINGHALPASRHRRSRSPVPIRVFWCVPEGRVHLVGESPTRVMVGWPGSWQAVRMGNWPYRSPATKAALGGRANRRAVTCVKPEQASKGKLWTPTRPKRGEGSTVWGSSRQMHLDRSTGVVGTARRDRGSRKRGRSTCDEGSDLNDAVRRRSVWKSDRVVVPLKPGNSGGGKDPDFWCVFEADEVG
jgi:hypothetical protein